MQEILQGSLNRDILEIMENDSIFEVSYLKIRLLHILKVLLLRTRSNTTQQLVTS